MLLCQDGYDCDGNAQTLAYNSLVYREDFSDGSAQNWNTSNGASGSQSTYQDNYSYWNMTADWNQMSYTSDILDSDSFGLGFGLMYWMVVVSKSTGTNHTGYNFNISESELFL